MSRVFIALFVLALIAPAAVAEQPAAETTAAPAVSDAAQPVAPSDEGSALQSADEPAGDLFQDLDPAREIEPMYICPAGCTDKWDCLARQEPYPCPQPCERICVGYDGSPCSGHCECT